MKEQTLRTYAAVALLAAITLYRICAGLHGVHYSWLDNFAPVAAVALCGGAYLPRRFALAVPLGALLLSDLFLNSYLHYPLLSPEMISRYVALTAIAGIGIAMRGRARMVTMLPAALLGSLFFYIITNTSSWIGSPEYARSIAGWLQALTTGLPGYEPTWMFFRSTLISDLIFTALFVLCMTATGEPEEVRETRPSVLQAVK